VRWGQGPGQREAINFFGVGQMLTFIKLLCASEMSGVWDPDKGVKGQSPPEAETLLAFGCAVEADKLC